MLAQEWRFKQYAFNESETLPSRLRASRVERALS
jgi:hypothetical protein